MMKNVKREIALLLAKKAVEIYEQCAEVYLIAPEKSMLWAFVEVKEAFGDFLRAIAFAMATPNKN